MVEQYCNMHCRPHALAPQGLVSSTSCLDQLRGKQIAAFQYIVYIIHSIKCVLHDVWYLVSDTKWRRGCSTYKSEWPCLTPACQPTHMFHPAPTHPTFHCKCAHTSSCHMFRPLPFTLSVFLPPSRLKLITFMVALAQHHTTTSPNSIPTISLQS